MIIDPENGLGDTGEVVHKQIDKAAKSKIKTIPSIDMLVGGGFLPGSLVLICCLSGHGKSLIMQNIAIYASINNKKEDFEVRDGMKPCILFVSYEMKLIQLLQRHLSFYGYSDKNLIYDTPKEELDKYITFYKALGLPTTLKEVKLDSVPYEDLLKIGTLATQEGETIHQMAVDYTADDVANALLAIDHYVTTTLSN